MEKTGFHRIAVPVILILLLCASAGCILSDPFGPRLYSVYSRYKLVITNDAPLYNVTLYIPLPVSNNIPTVGRTRIWRTPFEREFLSLQIVKTPPGLSPDDLFLVPGNFPLFLQMRADSWPPGRYVVEIPDPSIDVESPLLFVETLHPVGNQSVFLPKVRFLPPEPVRKPPSNLFSTKIEYSGTVVRQSVPVYVDYRSGANVSISSSITTENSWKTGYDSYYGNRYTDFFVLSPDRESHGWQLATGDFTAGDGFYPDFTKGEWVFFQRQ